MNPSWIRLHVGARLSLPDVAVRRLLNIVATKNTNLRTMLKVNPIAVAVNRQGTRAYVLDMQQF